MYEFCKCGRGTQHIFDCTRCGLPIDIDHLGFIAADGSIHEACGTTEEFDWYMQNTCTTEDETIAYMRARFEA